MQNYRMDNTDNNNVPRLICISIRLGKKFEPSPLPKLESDCAAPAGTAPKLAPG
jgi:hypothetical protein